MNSEKVKEIKEALEHNAKSGIGYDSGEKFCDIWFVDILNLINELESENKRLQDLCNKTYEDLTKEIDRLEKETKQLKQFAERLKESLNDMEYRAKTGRKTLRIEEVYEQMNWILHKVVQSKIDEVAKEMGVEL